MPTIAVGKEAIFNALGKEYTYDEFNELCFDFGLELEDDTTDDERPIVNGIQEPAQLKIEIPANRYDMLCYEGISLMLQIFLGKISSPAYKALPPPDARPETLTCTPATGRIRPYVSGAILRNITFTRESYESFIALQDKLHQNLARQRTLVAIGTHDLDTVKAPFTYDALPPEEIEFVPLNQRKKMNGKEMMDFYRNDRHLNRYLPIIRDSPVYPVIMDANRTVCSMPPIINSDHTKIKLTTRNVFIDITATDRTKLEIINQILVSMFSQYTQKPFEVEQIRILSPHNNQSRLAPDLTPRQITASLSYLNSCLGLDLSALEACSLLKRMSLDAQPSTDSAMLTVSIPPTRADVLHQADILEDLGIAYGFNKLPRGMPNISFGIGKPLPINKLCETIRLDRATAPWTEVSTLVLCSHNENFAQLNRRDDGTQVVRVANPKTSETEVVRTSLISGLLKTLQSNRQQSLPIHIFEIGDVVLKALELERKARNERRFAAAYCDKGSGLQYVHGLLDRLMLMLKSTYLEKKVTEDIQKNKDVGSSEYWIENYDHPTYFQAHAARIYLRLGGRQAVVIGELGMLHPSVLGEFGLKYPVSVLELNLEVFL